LGNLLKMKEDTIILGIEGTAWNLSAALVDERKIISEYEKPYLPKEGGIHPRDAAQSHASNIKEVISKTIKKAEIDLDEIKGVAFSIGPGMGPCLRTVATASRALSLLLKVPLLGVNHCVAHIEFGRWLTGAKNPLVLYVSGANSQVIAYRDKKYRIYGETLDIGVGNAIDKFSRFFGLKHPGGPKVEELAKRGKEYVRLPYVVKGMDFSFSGLVTAATSKSKENSLEDLSFSFQENAFSMLTEVTERALSYARRDELLLVGGVGANLRLREMLETVCEERGVNFFVPDRRYVGDNAMIAYTGLLMLKNGMATPIERSSVKPNFRPDEVEIPWF